MSYSRSPASGPRLEALLVPPEHLADPYPYYAHLRATDPVHRSAGGFWILTRYRDVEAVLRDHRFGPVGRRADEPLDPEVWPEGPDWLPELERRCSRSPEVRAATVGLTKLWLTNTEPPLHTRIRGGLSRDFTDAATAGWRPRILEIVVELLDGVEAESRFDVISALAVPLPARVVCEMLAVPAADQDRLIGQARALGPALVGDARPETVRAASDATLALAAYFDRRLRSHDRPLDGCLRRLRPRAAGDGLSEDDSPTCREVTAQALMLLYAGHETSAMLIGNSLLALLHNRDQLRQLRADPEATIGPAVEELLRYDSPVQFTIRAARREVRIGGRVIAAGDHLALALGAANRDPEIFPSPDRLDLARRPNPHLAFGVGLHHCLGWRLARAEAEIAIAEILRRRPRLALAAGEPERSAGGLLRGLKTLWVS